MATSGSDNAGGSRAIAYSSASNVAPRFAPDSYVLVLERMRAPEERDRFLWYCTACGAPLYEAVRQVADYREDPVSQVYEEFYGTESHRTCGTCGHTTPRPAPAP